MAFQVLFLPLHKTLHKRLCRINRFGRLRSGIGLHLEVTLSHYKKADDPKEEKTVGNGMVNDVPRMWNVDEQTGKPKDKVNVEEGVPQTFLVLEVEAGVARFAYKNRLRRRKREVKRLTLLADGQVTTSTDGDGIVSGGQAKPCLWCGHGAH